MTGAILMEGGGEMGTLVWRKTTGALGLEREGDSSSDNGEIFLRFFGHFFAFFSVVAQRGSKKIKMI